MIAWAQEVERYCDQAGQSYQEVVSFYDEIKFFPPIKYFPGVIGGHCVMPNIALLSKYTDSMLLEAIQVSNEMKIEREASAPKPHSEVLSALIGRGRLSHQSDLGLPPSPEQPLPSIPSCLYLRHPAVRRGTLCRAVRGAVLTACNLQGKRVAMVSFSGYPEDPRPRRAVEALLGVGMTVDFVCLGDEKLPKRESLEWALYPPA